MVLEEPRGGSTLAMLGLSGLNFGGCGRRQLGQLPAGLSVGCRYRYATGSHFGTCDSREDIRHACR